jgi:LuxR family maltose regulon positive regulatory protein
MTDAKNASLGALLRRYRVAAELSQEALAEKAHMSARGISDLERGVRSKPYRGTIGQLADALQLNASERAALEDAARRVRDEAPSLAQREVIPETDILLTTKLAVPPARAQLVARPRLLSYIEAGLQGPLTLLAAPAGSGKTTLLSAWRTGPAGRRIPVAWVSLDERDNDPVRFWRYVLTALEAAGVEVGAGGISLLQPPQPAPVDVVLTSTLNAMSTQLDDVILVLDDYHLIDDETIHQGLSFLLEHLPPCLHLVLSTRTDPPLPLARLRASGRVTEVRVDDLRFRRDEAAAFLTEVMGLELTPDQIEALEKRTEGWIAGLQLAALSLQGRPGEATSDFIASFAGSHRHVIDYLADEVLAQLPEPTQAFLLQTSILDRLNPSLCAFVMDEETTAQAVLASRELLEKLERSNLFLVPLDEQREWYRYHQLFAEALRHRLRQLGPNRVEQAHLRASHWFEQEGLLVEAIEHAFDAAEFERAGHLIARAERRLFAQSANATLWRLLNRLPDEILADHPPLCITKAWFFLDAGRVGEGEHWLDKAERGLQSGVGSGTSRVVRGELAAGRGFAASFRGDSAEVIARTEQALRDLDRDHPLAEGLAHLALGRAHMAECDLVQAAESYADAASIMRRSGNAYAVVRALFGQSQMERAQGHLGRAVDVCRQAIVWSAQGGHPHPSVGMMHLALSDLLRERSELDEAMRLAAEGARLFDRLGPQLDMDPHGFSLLALSRIEQALGHIDTALELLHQVEVLVEDAESPPPQTMLRAYEAQLRLLQGNLPAALDCAEEAMLTRAAISFDSILTFTTSVTSSCPSSPAGY